MNKKSLFYILLGLLFVGIESVSAQSPKKVVVEHFTNTRCSICGSRNPGLNKNLESSPEILHLAIHPSSPYSSCLLNKHNVSENDARTKYYGVYGSTPRVVVQGEAKSAGVDFTSKSLFSSYQGQTTPIEIKINTLQKGNDSLVVEVVIKTTEAHSLSNLSLYAVAVEDTVFYKSPNGEPEHHDVFRKVLLSQPITLPGNVGDSITFTVRTANHMDWDASRMYVMAMVQNDQNKAIEQVESSKGDEDTGTLGITIPTTQQIAVYPNPTSNWVTIKSPFDESTTLQVKSLSGQILKELSFTNRVKLDLSSYEKGMYLFSVMTTTSTQTIKVSKQ